jgi:hypothetical protein
VVMVDQNDAILKKSVDAIDKSIGRVAKKKVPDDTKVCWLLLFVWKLFIELDICRAKRRLRRTRCHD